MIKFTALCLFLCGMSFENINQPTNHICPPMNARQDILQSLLALASDFNSQSEITKCSNAVKQMSQELRSRIRPGMSPHTVVDLFTQYLFGELHFRYEQSLDNSEYALLPSVVRTKRGNCVGLATLYLALGSDD